tara:strand:- start:180 stop:545 length:366 start_codon:yes stop_codon:yes gene_type:complete
MRNAAMVLGLIAGLMGNFVSLFGFGYSELAAARPEVNQLFSLENPSLVRFASFVGPLLAIAGGAMAKSRALWGGALTVVAALLFYTAFGLNVATMFTIGFAALGGLLGVAARKPDEPKAHF